MSVISLSSEDDCLILESEDEDLEYRCIQPHQVFIVESNHSSTYYGDPRERIPPDCANNVGEQNMSYSCYNNITNLNEHLASDKIQIKKQRIEDFNNTSNQTLAVSVETKESGPEKECHPSISQRNEIFDAVQLTSVSRLTLKRTTDEPYNTCLTLPITASNQTNKSGNLKVLADKLAQVLGSKSHSDLSIKQFNNRENQEPNLSSIEKTILDVSKGVFKENRQENRLSGSNTTSQTNRNRPQIKGTKRKSQTIKLKTSQCDKTVLGAEVSNIHIHSNSNQLAQKTSENSEISQISLETTNCGKRSNIQTSQSRLTMHLPKGCLKPAENNDLPKLPANFKTKNNIVSGPRINTKSTFSSESKKNEWHKTSSSDYGFSLSNYTKVVTHHKTKKKEPKSQLKQGVVLKSNKKSANYTTLCKLPPLKNVGPYDNKLKFTFDRNISVYSVSVVSPTESQPPVENLSVCRNSPHVNDVGNSIEQNFSSCQKYVQQQTKGIEVTKHFNETSLHTEDNLPELENNVSGLQTGKKIVPNDFSLSMPFSVDVEDNLLEFENSENNLPETLVSGSFRSSSLHSEDNLSELENYENDLQPEPTASDDCSSSIPFSINTEDNLQAFENSENLQPEELSSSGFRSSIHTEDNLAEIKKNYNEPQRETVASNDCRSSSIPFSNILNLKSSFLKHYNTVFDDKTDALCVEMGYLLLQSIEELKKLQNLIETSQNESFEFKTAIKTCQNILHQSKKKFIDNFSQIHDKINLGHVVGTQLKIVFLTTWFMKVFLSMTSQSPDLMDILHDVKIKSLDMLSGEIVRWPLICKTFIKDERQFECDCLLVLGFIKDCLKDQHESNSQSNRNLCEVGNAVKPQTVACTSNDLGSHIIPATQCTSNSEDRSKEVYHLNHKRKRCKSNNRRFKKCPKNNNTPDTSAKSQKPNEHDTLENGRPTTPPSSNIIVENDTNRKIAGNVAKQFNVDNIPMQSETNCKEIQNQYLKEHVSNKKLVDQQTNHPIAFSSSHDLDYQKNQLHVEAQCQIPTPLKQSSESNVFLSAQSEIQYQPSCPVKSHSHGHQNIQYYQPDLQSNDTSPSMYSRNQYHSINQACNQKGFGSQTKTPTPISFQYKFFPTITSTSNSYKQQVSVSNAEMVEMSSCPISIRTPAYPVCDIMSNAGVTINNYNITNYIPPNITTNYNDPTISKP